MLLHELVHQVLHVAKVEISEVESSAQFSTGGSAIHATAALVKSGGKPVPLLFESVDLPSSSIVRSMYSNLRSLCSQGV